MIDQAGNSPRALGPLDRRTIVRRCAACAKRKVKCQGGWPCNACQLRDESCVPQKQSRSSTSVFVNVSPKPRETKPKGTLVVSKNDSQCVASISSRMPRAMQPDRESLYFVHFFSKFLEVNSFTGKDDMQREILSNLCHQSPILTNSIVAIGALDVSRDPDSSWQMDNQKSPKVAAIQAYRDSILQLRSAIANPAAVQNDATLWGTFFLSLFELMTDATGKGWLKHMSYGIYCLLQLHEPQYYLSGPGRSFFLTLRISELCRSLMSCDETFLAQRPWRDLVAQIWAVSTADWHPKEALFDILVDVAACSSGVVKLLQETSKNSNQPTPQQRARAEILAAEGTASQAKLFKWYSETFDSSTCTFTSTSTSPSSILSFPSPASSFSSLSSSSSSSSSSSYPSPSSSIPPSTPPTPSSTPCTPPALPPSFSLRTIKHDPQLMLALAYYHGICIFLSCTFDFYPCWTRSTPSTPTPTSLCSPSPCPVLSASEMNAHVLAILEICKYVLADGRLAPVLLVMPLEVAGAKSHVEVHRMQIVQMLREVAKRGFIVADRFVLGLQSRWEEEVEEEGGTS
ncbi:hypothetical protein L228DRAFT_160023 [Xylona heveae TC161]|uniref:Zn(2)-C6 fungal-type domain-containing protein n=1 Tax=Xylona heveae (strain CBS 132557 / TC161) TaxID=1328760 RepID=A0A165G6H0_XYLHT|nr:hypothetical protein L228DRAFT_160023 [Xylona heveae TC161]KZF21795.1 hypothetical protein L228DRAFT_160023 [Xylona heveae TC161]